MWDVDELIREYTAGRQDLKRLANKLNRNDPSSEYNLKHINKMIDSMTYSIDWMESGRQPGNYRGADKKAIYQRQFLSTMDTIPDITEQLEDINKKHLYMTQEEKIILADIFASLSLRERQCFILHAGQKMSMWKIAEEIGVSKGTVQGYIEKARKKVKDRVERESVSA